MTRLVAIFVFNSTHTAGCSPTIGGFPLSGGILNAPASRQKRANGAAAEHAPCAALYGLFPIEGVGPDFAVVGASVRG